MVSPRRMTTSTKHVGLHRHGSPLTATGLPHGRLVVVLAALLGACAGVTPAPSDINALSVSASVNVPDAPVMLYGHTAVEQMFGKEPVELERVIRADAERLLAERGFAVVRPGDGSVRAPVLEIEVTHWQPDEPARRWVLVDVQARLRDAPSDDAQWSYRRERWLVPTREATDSYRMQRIAAYKIVVDVLAGWRPPGSKPARPVR